MVIKWNNLLKKKKPDFVLLEVLPESGLSPRTESQKMVADILWMHLPPAEG